MTQWHLTINAEPGLFMKRTQNNLTEEGSVMEKIKNVKKIAGIILLLLCNIALITATVLFTIYYSNSIVEQKETSMKETFCNTIDTMKKISEQYLDTELSNAESWKSYIEHEHMTKDEAIRYIGMIEDQSVGETHIIDMETYDAVSTNYTNGSNNIEFYKNNSKKDEYTTIPFENKMIRIFNGSLNTEPCKWQK